MKSLKSLLCLLLCLLLALSCAACGAAPVLSMAALPAGGALSAGALSSESTRLSADELQWKLEDGVLTISGEGPMADYDDGDRKAPWM